MKLSLNGEWAFSLKSCRFEELTEQDWQGTMKVPSNWEKQGLHNYHGSVWLKRLVTLETLQPADRYWLQFKGVDYFNEVYVNGHKVGEHEGYFQTHEFEVTSLLKQGVNEFVCRVTSPLETPGTVWPNKKQLIKGVLNHHDARPGSWDEERGQDQNTGGIWHDVWLYSTPQAKIDRCKITPHLRQNEAVLTIETQVNVSERCQAVLHYHIQPHNFADNVYYECSQEVMLDRGTQKMYTVVTIAEPRLWWIWDQGEQALYQLTVTLEIEGIETQYQIQEVFGIREVFQDEQGRIYLNGRQVFIRGTNYIPTQWLSEFTCEQIAQDINLMKEANINGVRVHAHVTRKEFFEACDREGIFVWQDFALQWSYEESDRFTANAVKQIKEMVNQFYNHPSIMIWCCHNEPSTNRDYLDPLLYWAVKEEDAKRIVKEASDFTEHVYPGWYHGSYQEYTGLPGAPFVTEFGAQALPNLKMMRDMMKPEELWPPKWEVWAYHDFQYDETFNVAGINMGDSLEEFIANSQQYQADLLKFAIENYRRNKGKVTSLFQFMFVDCWPSITWSVVDYHRQPKKGYYALKQAYAPLLVSIEMLRKKVNPGYPLFKQIVVVNDYPYSFEDVSLKVMITDKQGQVYFNYVSDHTWNIAAQSVCPIIKLGLGAQPFWKVPETLEPGTYDIVLELRQGDKVLTANQEQFEVVAAVQRFDQKF
ncbi:beta-mannosidase [Caldalkalibacillus uzonensis]|uniref:beta-mannosidase n=1 Tax=Caldalkalibacillus uzonensis TaxID=353224 RepID=A0ABU0CQH7_9BACI|nr:glycoside hydrolase family 2 TIM barrel-domain containing protein [Caldalkalibacillus uzonensis]MDQ0338661.1 beta-mannosidase [Caldalkalibacillus uzonensis]